MTKNQKRKKADNKQAKKCADGEYDIETNVHFGISINDMFGILEEVLVENIGIFWIMRQHIVGRHFVNMMKSVDWECL